MKQKCDKCGHSWNTKSTLILITCPSCQLKVKNKNVKVERKDESA